MVFFCSNSAQQLQTLPEEILFGNFMTTLNDTSERDLTLENEGYESRSERLSISTTKNLSFTPLITAEQHPEQSP